MKTKTKRIISLLIAIIMISNYCTIAHAASETVRISNISGRKFPVSNGHVQSYGLSQPAEAEDLSLCIASNHAKLSVIIGGKQLDFDIQLLPSQFAIYKGNTIIGVQSNIDPEYKIASFRIEHSAYEIGLMEDNLELSNKTVLFLGVEHLPNSEIFYFQVEIFIDFAAIYAEVSRCYCSTEYTPADIEKIEISYLTLRPVSNDGNQSKRQSVPTTISSKFLDATAVRSNSTAKEFDELSTAIERIKNASKDGFVKVNNTRGDSLINGIPDDIYKSGALEVWKRAFDPFSTGVGYLVYPMQYAGTPNRLHYAMTFMLTKSLDYPGQEFDIGFRITQNCWVLYYAADDEVVIFNSQARAAVDVELSYETDDEYGVFTRRRYSLVKADTLWDLASKIVTGYYPTANAISLIYETITGGEALENNADYHYGDNYAQQVNQEEIVKKVTVLAEGLRQVGDYITLTLKGNSITTAYYLLRYWPYDPLA